MLKFLHEIQYFKKLNVKSSIIDEFKCQDEIKLNYDRVLRICTLVNRLLKHMTESEKFLFKDKIMHLIKKMSPGLGKITWKKTKTIEIFLHDIEKIYNDVILTFFLYCRNNLR